MPRATNVTGAASAALPGHVPEEVKEERWHRFMAVQSEIADARAQAMVGQTIDVIIDDTGGIRNRGP